MIYHFYTIHRGGRGRSVDYYENHVHLASCPDRPTQNSPAVIAAPSVDEAIKVHKAEHPDDSYVKGGCV